jgi:hypothetical protein
LRLRCHPNEPRREMRLRALLGGTDIDYISSLVWRCSRIPGSHTFTAMSRY